MENDTIVLDESQYTEATEAAADDAANETNGTKKSFGTTIKNIFGKAKTFFTRDESSDGSTPNEFDTKTGAQMGIKFIDVIVARAVTFAFKLKKKIGKFFKNLQKKHPMIGAIIDFGKTILSYVAAAIIAVLVLKAMIALLPKIAAIVVSCLAIAAIIELMFSAVETATSTKTYQAD